MSSPSAVPEPRPITVCAPRHITRPVMLQGWYDLTALHWRYQAQQVQALLPEGFSVDTFDGSAWVGIIPFEMRRIRVPGLPPFGSLSTFPETNLRTYIIDAQGRRGVWFFSLDVTRLIPALVARASYRLPYCWARMTVSSAQTDGTDGTDGPADRVWTYGSSRRWPRGRADTKVVVRVGAQLADDELTPLDHFLTARWALGSTFGSRRMWAEVDHPQWALHAAEVLSWDESLFAAAGLPAATAEPYARWSPGVEVRIGRPRVQQR